MAVGAETPKIAALPAIARLGACESARGPDADRHVKLLIQFAVEGSLSGAYSQSRTRRLKPAALRRLCVGCPRPPSERISEAALLITLVMAGPCSSAKFQDLTSPAMQNRQVAEVKLFE
jgi:hypothetical protein